MVSLIFLLILVHLFPFLLIIFRLKHTRSCCKDKHCVDTACYFRPFSLALSFFLSQYLGGQFDLNDQLNHCSNLEHTEHCLESESRGISLIRPILPDREFSLCFIVLPYLSFTNEEAHASYCDEEGQSVKHREVEIAPPSLEAEVSHAVVDGESKSR